MDTQWLLTFDKILQTGTFAKAAEALGYTQSTVTFHIHQLEQELGVKLFDKVGRRMVLSKAGHAIIPTVNNLLHMSEQLKSINVPDNQLAGALTVFVSESIFEHTALYETVRDFLYQAPRADLCIKTKQCTDIAEAVKAGECDIGLLYQVEGNEDTVLDVVRLQDVEMVLVASAKSTDEWNALTQTLGECRPRLLTDPRCAFRRMYRNYVKRNHLPTLTEINLGGWGNVMNGVQDNLGIAFAPVRQVKDKIDSGLFRVLSLEDMNERVYVAMILRKGKRSLLQNMFYELAKKHLMI